MPQHNETQLVLDLLIHVAASISPGAYINPEYKHDLLGMLGKAKDNLEPKVYLNTEDEALGIEYSSDDYKLSIGHCHTCGWERRKVDGHCVECNNVTVEEEPGDETLSEPPIFNDTQEALLLKLKEAGTISSKSQALLDAHLERKQAMAAAVKKAYEKVVTEEDLPDGVTLYQTDYFGINTGREYILSRGQRLKIDRQKGAIDALPKYTALDSPTEYKGYHPEVDFDKVAKEAMAKVTGAPEDYKVTPVRAGYETVQPPKNYIFLRTREKHHDIITLTGIVRWNVTKEAKFAVEHGARLDWAHVFKQDPWLWDE